MNNVMKLVGVLTGFLFTSVSWAYTIDGGSTDVGSLDSVVASETLSNSGNAEEYWVKSLLGDSAYIGEKFEEGTLSPVLVDGETNIYAHDLGTDFQPYFLIKIGGGNWDGDTHFLYMNDPVMQFGVFSLGDFLATCTDGCQINIGKVSHIANVPEPSAIALMGMGLVGVGFAARRRSRKQA